MAAMPSSAGDLAVTLYIGGTRCDLGSVEIPIGAETTTPANLTVRVVMPELRRRIADLLREAAQAIEDGSSE
jgi:hypothetical protein